jgi:hypothetical protein
MFVCIHFPIHSRISLKLFEQVAPPTSGQTAGFLLAHKMTKNLGSVERGGAYVEFKFMNNCQVPVF